MVKRGLAVEMYFDGRASAQFSALTRELCPFLAEIGAQPHFSLAVFPEQPHEGLLSATRHFAGNIKPFEIKFSSIGTFPTGEGVVFVAPVASEALLALHKDFIREVKGQGIEPSPYYLPGNWVPHVTIGIDLDEAAVLHGIRKIKAAGFPSTATVSSIGLISFRPVEMLWRQELVCQP